MNKFYTYFRSGARLADSTDTLGLISMHAVHCVLCICIHSAISVIYCITIYRAQGFRLVSRIPDMNVSATELLFTGTNGVSLLACLLATILVFAFKLYRKVVYRLALYQVLSSLFLATVDVFQLVFVNYTKNPEVYGQVCTAVGWLFMYTLWMKLLFTMWVIVHLFCFGVLHKNLKKFEVFYVVTSLLVPGAIACVPLITHSYGLSSSRTVCFIFDAVGNSSEQKAVTERLILWDTSAIIILLAGSIAMVVMLIKLTRQASWFFKYEPITNNDQFSKAVQQLLPLSAFPILFFVFIIPQLIYDIYSIGHAPSRALIITSLVFASLWSMTSGLSLIIHIVVVRCVRKRKGHLTHVELLRIVR